MKIIVLSPSTGDPLVETTLLVKLFELGLETFHLRKPRFSTNEMKAYLDLVPPQFHNRIVIHSHHRLCLHYGLKGIHLTRTHMKRKFRLWLNLRLIHMKRSRITISTSFRKLASLYEEENKYDYVFLSPIFDSISGKFQAGFNVHSLKAAIQKTPFTIIARGGVDLDKIPKIQEVGFYGLTLNSSLWNSPDPPAEFIKILDELKRLDISLE
ncbi:MAG: thiamine phosphate synthase [Bacteroidia bacterium]